jgi:hypothetical protein
MRILEFTATHGACTSCEYVPTGRAGGGRVRWCRPVCFTRGEKGLCSVGERSESRELQVSQHQHQR